MRFKDPEHLAATRTAKGSKELLSQYPEDEAHRRSLHEATPRQGRLGDDEAKATMTAAAKPTDATRDDTSIPSRPVPISHHRDDDSPEDKERASRKVPQ